MDFCRKNVYLLFYCYLLLKMLTDAHCHKIDSGEHIRSVYNIMVNDEAVTLPQGKHVFFSAGIHPQDIGNIRSSWFDNMESLLSLDRAIAVGECGLDKNLPSSTEKQMEVFEMQVRLSEKFKKPLIIHCVGRYNELMHLHRMLVPKQCWIIHGFRGKPEMARQLTKAGMYLSFGAKFNPDSVRVTPLNRLLVESDESDKEIEEIYSAIALAKSCEISDLVAADTVFKPESIIV